MKYRVTLERRADGGWEASCADPRCTATGDSESKALEAIQAEIRYRLELCPCTTLTADAVEVVVGS